MKHLSYNEQMKTNGGRTVCVKTSIYKGSAVNHYFQILFWSTTHKDYYMGKQAIWYCYG
ncbi:MAG: hypothetical protein J1E85_03475 [Ruminococcus sp.]|nr:hypothetical protein [Ruminococcus sp.]